MPVLLGIDALKFLEEEGFPVLRSRLAVTEEEAVEIAREIGFPVTLKISGKKTFHKTDLGGVKTGICEELSLRKAFRELKDLGLEELKGIIVQEEGRGLEIIIGVHSDTNFGKVLMVGQGGIYTDLLGDVAFRLLPLSEKDARSIIDDLSISKIFSSKRKELKRVALEELVMRVAELAIKKSIIEMDLNPVFLLDEAKICDAKIELKGGSYEEDTRS